MTNTTVPNAPPGQQRLHGGLCAGAFLPHHPGWSSGGCGKEPSFTQTRTFLLKPGLGGPVPVHTSFQLSLKGMKGVEVGPLSGWAVLGSTAYTVLSLLQVMYVQKKKR
jgi:hypothetical protein